LIDIVSRESRQLVGTAAGLRAGRRHRPRNGTRECPGSLV
jgi:hypothetical protein